MKNTKEAVIEVIYLIVSEYSEIKREDINEETRFDELKMDDFDKIEAIMEMERNFNMTIEDDAEETQTIGELISHIEAREHTIPETIRVRFNNSSNVEEEAEVVGEIKYLSSDEVEKLDSGLYYEIDEYVNRHIATWEECCECQEEAEALEFFLDHHLPSWRVRNNGTIDVVVEGESREQFDFEWQDEDGEDRVSNAFNRLNGNVSHQFDEAANNEVHSFYSSGLKSKIEALFKS